MAIGLDKQKQEIMDVRKNSHIIDKGGNLA